MQVPDRIGRAVAIEAVARGRRDGDADRCVAEAAVEVVMQPGAGMERSADMRGSVGGSPLRPLVRAVRVITRTSHFRK